jgi:hypothetical protein
MGSGKEIYLYPSQYYWFRSAKQKGESEMSDGEGYALHSDIHSSHQSTPAINSFNRPNPYICIPVVALASRYVIVR